MLHCNALAHARTASDVEIALRKRREICEILYNDIGLMSNFNYQSVLQLALRAMRRTECRASGVGRCPRPYREFLG